MLVLLETGLAALPEENGALARNANHRLRQLPSVDQLLRHPAIRAMCEDAPLEQTKLVIRNVIDEIRTAALSDRVEAVPDAGEIALRVRARLHERRQPHLRRVINATGIVLHTGLGRAPLPDEALDAIVEVARGYCNLELDLAGGGRGDRQDHLRELLTELTGAQDALVVNNNAAATFLTLHALAKDAGVIVSRGQLVEIGGSYRMPDIMAAAGCRMVEVGTTNRTHLHDYQLAIDQHTRVLLHVHTSNYRISGFATSVAVAELAQTARQSTAQELVVVDDLGSGLLDREHLSASMDSEAFADEPSVRESLAAGADLVLFSGDKLLGGPQAGIIVGRSDLIGRIQKNPLTRTHRPDKLCIAALTATLGLYRDPSRLAQRLPSLEMLRRTPERMLSLAEQILESLRPLADVLHADIQRGTSFAGGGALPTLALPTVVLQLRACRASAGRLAEALRNGCTPVVARIHGDGVQLDCRTLSQADSQDLPRLIGQAVRECAAKQEGPRQACPDQSRPDE